MSRSMDSLKLLLLEKTQTMQLLERIDNGDSAYNDIREEIDLIRKAIRLKEDQSD